MDEEMDKVWKDVRENNFGIFDIETKRRVNPEMLQFFWNTGMEQRKIKEEVMLHRDLMIIEKMYNEKFGKQSHPLSLDLFNDPEKFVERLIRAVEICTLRYVLNKGGALNKCPCHIIKTPIEFVWS